MIGLDTYDVTYMRNRLWHAHAFTRGIIYTWTKGVIIPFITDCKNKNALRVKIENAAPTKLNEMRDAAAPDGYFEIVAQKQTKLVVQNMGQVIHVVG